jgi:tetratricopeptide (TPR) repeat protein
MFLGPAATLALTFSWIEEGERKRALEAALRNSQAYPTNVINNLVLGRIYYYVRDYPSSERIFQEVLAVAPDNQRVHYHLATLYTRTRAYDKALRSLDQYLTFQLSAEDRGLAWYKKGNIHYALQQWPEAERAFAQAVKADSGLKRAKQRLDKLREQKPG